MYITTKSVASNFNGSLNSSKFHIEITASSITSTLIGINVTGDVVEIMFDNELTTNDAQTLTALTAAHNGTIVKPKRNSMVINPKNTTIKTPIYSTSAIFKYGGSSNIGAIDYIEIIAYKDTNVTSYGARIVNRNNGQVIAESTNLTNNDTAVIDLGTINNVPADACVCELQVKRTGSSGSVYIDSIIVYYGN